MNEITVNFSGKYHYANFHIHQKFIDELWKKAEELESKTKELNNH